MSNGSIVIFRVVVLGSQLICHSCNIFICLYSLFSLNETVYWNRPGPLALELASMWVLEP